MCRRSSCGAPSISANTRIGSSAATSLDEVELAQRQRVVEDPSMSSRIFSS